MANTKRSRRWWTVLLTLAMSLGFATLNAPSASAAYVIGTDFLRNWETGLCLNNADAGRINTQPCQSGNDRQKWSVIYQYHAGYDFVQIVNVATNQCLVWSYNGSLYAGDCNAGTWDERLWRGVGSGWNMVELTDGGINDRYQCLDSDRNGWAYLLGCNGGGYQKWRLGY